ncbi:hypothetical protein [Paraburkholderia sp. MM5384-R2]|uniref:hypothetical protein n=1 Tax=Paraburkholderia sp. MM5384-R2 TaxID=2723097 RepID=UPI00160B24B3|nr:hypothetical protein [Paraburkholderia sp. MM5384-R2]MBB5496929.1 hypothetical protein [Paraburkholderia sp. MM5384-R2]
MLSGLSKLLDKAFILGFFLPALLGFTGFLAANADIPAFCDLLHKATSDSDKVGSLFSFLFIVWVLSLILLVLNNWFYQVLEGYKWPFNREAWKRDERNRRNRQLDLIERLRTELATENSAIERLKASKESLEHRKAESNRATVRARLYRNQERNARDFPRHENLVLPTAFGNTLRAFEGYSSEVYKVDSIFVWPRLLAVIPKDYQAIIADARAPVDFLVGLVVLGTFTSIFTLVRAIDIWLADGLSGNYLLADLFQNAAIAAAIAAIAYRLAILEARSWGDVVKSAFDLYLPALAEKLGFVLPTSQAAQREFWAAWSTQFRFHAPANTAWWTRIKPVTPAAATKADWEATDSAGETDEVRGG